MPWGSIKPLANAVVSKLQNLNYLPDEIGAMFGMSLNWKRHNLEIK